MGDIGLVFCKYSACVLSDRRVPSVARVKEEAGGGVVGCICLSGREE